MPFSLCIVKMELIKFARLYYYKLFTSYSIHIKLYIILDSEMTVKNQQFLLLKNK